MRKIKGDLVELLDKQFFDIVAHGCNCMNLMGSGIAKQLADKYPEVLEADKLQYELTESAAEQLGTVSSATLPSGQVVYNLYTQIFPGKYFDLDAFVTALKTMAKLLPEWHEEPRPKIGLPYIGCGIGGYRHPDTIELVVASVLKDYDVYMVEYEPKQNSGT
jgi:O-acetyl-ADP-ribose deacetylase (regulator of RNase III)